MAQKILSARMDFMFKLIFGNQKNVDILSAFLLSVLDIPRDEFDSLTIVDPHLQRFSEEDKLGILDVKVHTCGGMVIDVEIQVLPLSYIDGRLVFYTSKMVVEQIRAGEPYTKIKRVISILIADYTLIEDDRYHHRFRLIDRQTGKEFTDLIEIDVLELPKLPKEEDGSDLWVWMKFLCSERKEDLDMLAEKSAELTKAVGVLMDLSEDERTRMLYDEREKAWRDEQARTLYAAEQGMARGMTQGRLEGLTATAKNMLRRGRPLDEIAEDTGLPMEEIEALSRT